MSEAHLEQLLHSLRPTQPSAGLEQRVERDIALAELFRDAPPSAAEPARPAVIRASSWRDHLAWAIIGAAAAVLIMSVLPVSVKSGAQARSAPVDSIASSPSVLPVNSTREWTDMEEGSITYPATGTPAQQVRVRGVQRHQWIDPRDGAEYTVEVPVSDSMLMPVKFQ